MHYCLLQNFKYPHDLSAAGREFRIWINKHKSLSYILWSIAMKKQILYSSIITIIFLINYPQNLFPQTGFPDWHESIVEWTVSGNDTFYSKSNNSATLSWAETYNLQTYNLMFEVDNDTIWLNKLSKHGYDIMASAQDVPDDTSVSYDPKIADGYLGWGTDHYSDDGNYTEYLVHEGHFCTELAKFVLTVYQNDVLYNQFGTRADSILHFLEKNVVGKWYAVWDSNLVVNPSGTLDGSYPNWVGSENLSIIPVNQYVAYGHFLLELIQISKTNYYTPYNTDYLPWYQQVVTDMATEFRSMLHYLPEIDAYTWKYAKNCCTNDVSHSAIDVMYAYECYQNGIEFDFTDMNRFANLYVRQLWKNPQNVWDAELWDFFDQSESGGNYDKDSRKWGIYTLFSPWIGGIQSGVYRNYAITGSYGCPQASGIATLAWINKYCLPLTSPVNVTLSEKNGDGDNMADPGEELNLFIGISNWGNKSLDSLIVTIQSDDERIEITKAIMRYPLIGSMDTAISQLDTFAFKVKEDVSNGGKVLLRILMKYKGKTVKDSVYLTINPVSVLLVDDDGGADFESYYTNGVLDNIASYTRWDMNKLETPTAYLNKYKTVIWFTGDDSLNTLTKEDREGIKAYLDGGGKFILFSSKVQDDLLESEQPDTSFFENYLHTYTNEHWQRNDYFTLTVVNQHIYPSLYLSLTPKSNHIFRAINSKPESNILVKYFFGGGSAGGIYTLSTHRMAYLTFGVENLIDGLDEAAQIERRRFFLSGVMSILNETTSIKNSKSNIPTEFRLSAYPNPFNSQVTFKFYNTSEQTIKLSIYDVRGKLVKSLSVKNANSIQWNGKNQEGLHTGSGIYLVRVQNGDTVKNYKIVQIK